MLGAGDRMRRHEMHICRQVRRHVAHHFGLDGTDIGDDCAGREMRSDFTGGGAALADRNADDDEIGAFDRGRIGVDDLIRDAEFHDAPARLRRTRGRHDAADEVLRPRGARDRGADQADPDQCEAPEWPCPSCHSGPRLRRVVGALPRPAFAGRGSG